MSETRPELAVRYGRCLLGYPREYRRSRGDEIVGTFLALASPDRTRPTLREAVNLLRHGMRCRLGRPSSRMVVLWAMLAAIVCGLFSAAFAVRVAWETARPLPSPAEATPLFAQLLPGHDLSGKIDTSPATFVIYGQPLGTQNWRDLLFGDGGEYQFGATTVSVGGSFAAAADLRQAFAAAAGRLRDDGWNVTEPVVSRLDICPGCDPTTEMTLEARRSSDIIELYFLSQPGVPAGDPKAGHDGYQGTTYLNVGLTRATPWAVYPAAVVGGLFGSLVGWLMFGWASRRIERQHVGLRVLTGSLYAFAMFLWVAPMILAAPSLLRQQLSEHHFRWHPLWEWLGQPTCTFPFLVGVGLTLIALAAAALCPERSSATIDPAPHRSTSTWPTSSAARRRPCWPSTSSRRSP